MASQTPAGAAFTRRIAPYLRLGYGFSNRDIIWNRSLELIAEAPLSGLGPGRFAREYLARFGLPSYIEELTAERELKSLGRVDLYEHWHAHNYFLHCAAESGLPAAALAALFFAAYFQRGPQLNSARPDRWIATGCSAAVAGSLVHSLFEVPIHLDYPPIGGAFMAVVAIGLGS